MNHGYFPDWDGSFSYEWMPSRSRVSWDMEGDARPFDLDAVRVYRGGWLARFIRWCRNDD